MRVIRKPTKKSVPARVGLLHQRGKRIRVTRTYQRVSNLVQGTYHNGYVMTHDSHFHTFYHFSQCAGILCLFQPLEWHYWNTERHTADTVSYCIILLNATKCWRWSEVFFYIIFFSNFFPSTLYIDKNLYSALFVENFNCFYIKATEVNAFWLRMEKFLFYDSDPQLCTRQIKKWIAQE
jgi:hypothetical protein